MRKWIFPALMSLTAFGACLKTDATQWGRYLENKNDGGVNFVIGRVLTVDGSVKETTRPYFDVTGQPEKQKGEDYSLEELGFDGGYPTYGLELEGMWRFVTLQFRANYLRADADNTADRNFYVGVSEVSFEGKDYEYMYIPKGTDYSVDLEGGVLAFRALITPVTLAPKDYMIEVVPFVYVGLFSFFGQYDIDAGEPQGVISYETPSHEYVVGGQGSGQSFIAVPEIGIGSELRIGLNEVHGREVALVFQGYYSVLQYDGTTDNLGIGSSEDKDLDLDYSSYEGRVFLEFPISQKVDGLLGVSYMRTDAQADVKAKDRPVEEIIELREKFDKKIDFEMEQFTVLAGLRF
jgi:hypothetical protein